jgi:hypothetical protein
MKRRAVIQDGFAISPKFRQEPVATVGISLRHLDRFLVAKIERNRRDRSEQAIPIARQIPRAKKNRNLPQLSGFLHIWAEFCVKATLGACN